MTGVIAVTGKGGTGKTTFSALIVRYLLEEGVRPVLAVDADSNSNLHLVLGVDLPCTIGSIREEMTRKAQSQKLAPGMSKQELLEMQIEQALVEAEDFDLISMGRPEGPGCYCAINNMLRVFLDRLSDHYRFVVIDNEAGMEHLSRRTTRGVDVMFVVSDPSTRGLETARRIRDLAEDMDIGVARYYLVVSRAGEGVDDVLDAALGETDLELAGVVPDDPEVRKLDAEGRPLTELTSQSPAVSAVRRIMEEVLQGVS